MGGIPNRAERMFPMDFLRTNTKLLYKEVYSSNIPLAFCEWSRSVLLGAIGKTKPDFSCKLQLNLCAAWRLTGIFFLSTAFEILPQAQLRSMVWPDVSFFGFDIFFIRREFDVYGRKLINNIHSLRHSLRPLILVMFVMSLNIKYKAQKIRPNFLWGRGKE